MKRKFRMIISRFKNNIRWKHILRTCLLLAFLVIPIIVLVYKTHLNDPQSSMTFPMAQEFTGEIRQGDGDWQEYTGQKISSLEGDVSLRGNYSKLVPGTDLYLYLDHIYASVTINGEVVFSSYDLLDSGLDVCYTHWEEVVIPADVPEDALVEITLSNPHTSGNPLAFQHFLGNMYMTRPGSYKSFIVQNGALNLLKYPEMLKIYSSPVLLISGSIWKFGNWILMIVGIMMLAFSIMDAFQGSNFGTRIWLLSFLTLFVSGLMRLDRPNVDSELGSLLMMNLGAQLCRIMISFLLLLYITHIAAKWRKKLLMGITGIYAIGSFVIMVGANNNLWRMCNALDNLFPLHCMIMFIVFLIGCYEIFKHRTFVDTTVLLLNAAILLECINARVGWSIRGIFFNSISLIEIFVAIIWVGVTLPKYYRKANLAHQMETELAQAQVSIALSQIQPHFLFNSLTAIRCLSLDDPDKVGTALDHFAKYLRGNLSALKQPKPIPFDTEIANIKAYLALEELRYGEDLQVIWDLELTDFMLPSLTIQPLVENAVKHGIGKKKQGGTVTIAVRRKKRWIEITVSDNGVGFDPENPRNDPHRQHIGLENVRRRLEMMCHGTMQVDSVIGEGTRITVCLPRGESEKNERSNRG